MNVLHFFENKINILGINYLFFPELMISVFIIVVAMVGIFNIVISQHVKAFYTYTKKRPFLQIGSQNLSGRQTSNLNLSRFYIYFSIFFMCLMLFVYINFPRICIFNNSYILNNEIWLAKIFLISMFILFLFLFLYFINVFKYILFEVILLVLFSFLGLLFILSSNDFISLFLSIELYSFSMYLTIALFRRSLISLEAAFKYFIIGSISSIFLLIGSAIIYGIFGSFYFPDVALLSYFFSNENYFVTFDLFLVKLALFLIIISLFIKIAVAPFHLWSIDVYDGAPFILMFFLLILTKFSFLFILFKMLLAVFWSFHNYYHILLAVALVGTYVVGIVGAILQTKIRRIFIYSSIGNISFFFACILLNNSYTIPLFFYFSLFYFLSSALMIFFTYVVIAPSSSPTLHSFIGLFWKSKLLTFLIIVALLLSAGFPPAVSFFPKFIIMLNLFKTSGLMYKMLAVLLVVGTSFGIFYYIRLVRLLFIKNFDVGYSLPSVPFSSMLVFIALLLFLLISVFFCETILDILWVLIFYDIN